MIKDFRPPMDNIYEYISEIELSNNLFIEDCFRTDGTSLICIFNKTTEGDYMPVLLSEEKFKSKKYFKDNRFAVEIDIKDIFHRNQISQDLSEGYGIMFFYSTLIQIEVTYKRHIYKKGIYDRSDSESISFYFDENLKLVKGRQLSFGVVTSKIGSFSQVLRRFKSFIYDLDNEIFKEFILCEDIKTYLDYKNSRVLFYDLNLSFSPIILTYSDARESMESLDHLNRFYKQRCPFGTYTISFDPQLINSIFKWEENTINHWISRMKIPFMEFSITDYKNFKVI